MFSRNEILDFVKSTALLSLIFGVLIFRGSSATGVEAFLITMAIAFVMVGISFVLHELAHKFTAIRFHCITEYRTDVKMLLLGLFMALFMPFIFFSAGGVRISNVKSKKQKGIIALAGPSVNILFSIIFLSIYLYFNSQIAYYGFFINSWLALFNMLPFGGFDGKKVLAWDKKTYGITFALTILIYAAQYF